MSTWALVPVKRLQGAKKRLSDKLSESERSSLAGAMLTDVLNALEEANSLDGIALVTRDEDAVAMAANRGHRVIPDPEAGGLNEALSHAVDTLKVSGATTILVIHGDVPAVTGAEIDRLLAAEDQSPFVTLAPALTDGGTNGMVLSPPDIIPLHYGADSAALHLGAAKQAGINTKSLELRGLGLDIDHSADLLSFLSTQQMGNTLDYLLASGLAKRLQEQQ